MVDRMRTVTITRLTISTKSKLPVRLGQKCLSELRKTLFGLVSRFCQFRDQPISCKGKLLASTTRYLFNLLPVRWQWQLAIRAAAPHEPGDRPAELLPEMWQVWGCMS